MSEYERDTPNRSVLIKLPGGATQNTQSFIDGQTHSLTGSAIITKFFDYGVDPGSSDQIVKTESSYRKIATHWYENTKKWYPLIAV